MCEPRLGLETHAVQRSHGAAVLGDKNRLQIVVAARPIEHFEGAGDVEQINALVDGHSQPVSGYFQRHGETPSLTCFFEPDACAPALMAKKNMECGEGQ